jgi:DNA-binding PadR family transcriptional regulator
LSEQYATEDGDIETQVLNDLEIEIIKNHLKIILLLTIKRKGALGGYDLLQHAKKKYKVNLSPGTVYTQLYGLERKNLLIGQMDSSGKRVYSLTSDGIKTADIILSLRVQIEKMFALLFE